MMKKWIAVAAVACMVLVTALAAGCGVGMPGSSLPAVGQNVDFGKWGASGSESPIVWRVLTNDGSTALLIAQGIIDYQPFDSGTGGFSGSTLHAWLNNAFYTGAFTAAERAALSGASGSKVSLLSLADAQSILTSDAARAAAATVYAQGEGASNTWWLSADVDSTHAAAVGVGGAIIPAGVAKTSNSGVRPVIRLSLSAVSAVTDADMGTQLASSTEGVLGASGIPSSDPLTLFVHDASIPSLSVTGYTADFSGITVNCSASAALAGNQKVFCLLSQKDGPVAYLGWSNLTGGQAHFTGMDPSDLGLQYHARLCVGTVVGNNVTNYAGTVVPIDPFDALKVSGIKAGDTLDKGSAVTITAAGPGTGDTDPMNNDRRWMPISWSVLDAGSISQGSGTWIDAPYTAQYTPTSDGPQTLNIVFQQQQFYNGEWGIVESLAQTRTMPFTVAEPITLTLSPASGEIYTGGRITITPSAAGGTWSFDSAYLKRSGNEFTGRKAGTTRVTYTLGNRSVYADVTILASSLPGTGQDFTPVLLLGALALLAAMAAVSALVVKRVKRPVH